MSKEVLLNRIQNDFTYHPPNNTEMAGLKQIERYVSIRNSCRSLAEMLVQIVPESRELSLALTHLEEVSMWANAGIARNEKEA